MVSQKKIDAVFEELSLQQPNNESKGYLSTVFGTQRWYGARSVVSKIERLPLTEVKSLLNDSKEMARLARDKFALERLQSMLGLRAYSYLGGFWNYYPTHHDNVWQFSPLIVTSYELRYRIAYWVNGWGFVDPAIRLSISHRQTTLWNTDEFSGPSEALGRFAQSQGVYAGVTVPVFRHGSEVALLSFIPSINSFITAEFLYEFRDGLRVFSESFHDHAFLDHCQKIRTSIRLTPREKEVLELIVTGLRNVDIAQNLQLSESSIRKHQDKIRDKLRVDNRNDIPAQAIALGLTTLASTGQIVLPKKIR